MYNKSKEKVLKELGVNQKEGLSSANVERSRKVYGANKMTRAKEKSLLKRVIEALSEPMLIILLFALVVTFGINIGKAIRTGDGDFVECIGILVAVLLSVFITIIMEGKSRKAFELISRITENTCVKALRDGKIKQVKIIDLVVGDIVFLNEGDKVAADGRLLSSDELSVDESLLTGESKFAKKDAEVVLASDVPTAERKNYVYSGTPVMSGSGIMVVCAVGDKTEIGKIAGAVQMESRLISPLNEKLRRLTKVVSWLGGICAAAVFVLSIIRLAVLGNLDFENIQRVFVKSIVLIVAAVPEGLPTIVAISLSLNVVKLASENALIKKLVAAETAGCVSVICSDKTGTLTKNKMVVESICRSEFCDLSKNIVSEHIYKNIVLNSTADIIKEGKDYKFCGSPTECALLVAYEKEIGGYIKLRAEYEKSKVEPFSSDKKYMLTALSNGVTYIKGAPEYVFKRCNLTAEQEKRIQDKISGYQNKGGRVISFCHNDDQKEPLKFVFDGFAVISDPVRDDIADAVETCKQAGIAVKIITGDNAQTAFSVASQLKLASSLRQVVGAEELNKLSDEEMKRALDGIVVVARCVPLVKKRIVRLLMEKGEVVAVTGDGINDAPALKAADIGIAMGSGSEIAKETCDVVLLDDSFSTIVKAIAFGRGTYANFTRFILFQLTVNVSAMILIILSLLLGLPVPFTSLQLLWINIIMDGPPALTLGLEPPPREIMKMPPVKRSANLITFKVAMRIVIHSIFIAAAIIAQMCCNYLGAKPDQLLTVAFTMFVVFQTFNAFNCRQTGSVSAFKNLSGNKAMPIVFLLTFLFQVFITQFGGALFSTTPLSFTLWLKIIGCCGCIILLSEGYKRVYAFFGRRGKTVSYPQKSR